MSTILSHVKGFVPVIDVIIKDVGLITANVYGRVWRYCQMETGVCSASVETIASELGLSTKTVRRHLVILCSHNYLTDLTPTLRNKPHTYADTGKVVIEGLLKVNSPEQKEQPETPTEDGQKVQPEEKGWSESPTEVGQRVQPRLVRESNEESLLRKSFKKDAPSPTAREAQPLAAPPQTPPKQSADPKAIPEAVAVLKRAAGRYPAKSWYTKIEKEIGETPQQLEQWKTHVTSWVGRGYNPTNVEGMLDAFKNGGLKTQRHQPSRLRTKPPAEAVDPTIREKQREALAKVRSRQKERPK